MRHARRLRHDSEHVSGSLGELVLLDQDRSRTARDRCASLWLGSVAAPARRSTIVLKDGRRLQGSVGKVAKLADNPLSTKSDDAATITFVDDDLRRVFFPTFRIQPGGINELNSAQAHRANHDPSERGPRRVQGQSRRADRQDQTVRRSRTPYVHDDDRTRAHSTWCRELRKSLPCRRRSRG